MSAARGEIGANVRRIRAGVGISLETLAHEAGSHVTVISKVEQGINEPDMVTLIKLAHTLELTIEQVIHGPATSVRERRDSPR